MSRGESDSLCHSKSAGWSASTWVMIHHLVEECRTGEPAGIASLSAMPPVTLVKFTRAVLMVGLAHLPLATVASRGSTTDFSPPLIAQSPPPYLDFEGQPSQWKIRTKHHSSLTSLCKRELCQRFRFGMSISGIFSHWWGYTPANSLSCGQSWPEDALNLAHWLCFAPHRF